MSVIIGIDPGQSGGLGAIASDGRYLGSIPMPVMVVSPTIKAMDVVEILGWFERMSILAKATARIYIEQVSSRPCEGVKSVFSFGVGYGGLLAVAALSGCPYELVTPNKWKKALALNSDKKLSLGRARALWPDAPLGRMKDEGVAEALLLAEYARTKLVNA